jgi:hypothetical protein
MLCKYSAPASYRKQCISITKPNWLILLAEIISAFYENYTKSINKLCKQIQN